MKRRHFLKAIIAGVIVAGLAPEVFAEIVKIPPATPPRDYDDHIKDYLHKMQHFDEHHEGDFYLDRKRYRLLESSVKRLKRLQRTVGHGNFYLLDFDDALKIARNYSRVGQFPKAELDFLEMIFYEGAALYGFFGEKPLKNLTDRIQRRKVVKVPYTGNYLYKGLPLETYKKIKQDMGDQVILTSGVRSVIKQFLLFLNKAYKSKGNLSMASRSLAPPGYSFHGVGDFDVGQAGFGAANFTERFTTTEVYRKLVDLGYIALRYPQDNLLGVRFEPWHIKVNSKA
ncbi:MAG: M15 family metallopeptidase [Deltaproteobacteria bacterium]|nr:M15 family metallopeptidase [Deltaproteobacteria bacterium]MBW2018564.1 M15 family metallopeptidase [Deltaproteobacteria bacterium]MBW2073299.1 M15 family metallopeptidase [Deltaproteobacteria bacterium]